MYRRIECISFSTFTLRNQQLPPRLDVSIMLRKGLAHGDLVGIGHLKSLYAKISGKLHAPTSRKKESKIIVAMKVLLFGDVWVRASEDSI